ncbi:hypothetical protein TUN199_11440 [Pyrenophora tritici-repentis]|nr:hypothetical protein Alg215_10464 [Pyrenophora tritici-repentis]KAI0616568.1 hypothetical protein TUN199_11440 [Pyrenophora tritici-repentis]KAI1527429.1 hypothetical protein PtrSN001C_009856 [Pyrenophora tritici-repentis]KAI1597749.1 hypothetical protein PtrCC142_008667 [Pyrenophora tritici-repentis]
MAQDVFDCLLEVAPKYVDTITLPSGWMHRTELQTAVAGYAKPGSAFKRKYQDLEYQDLEYQDLEYQNSEHARPSKRSCTESNQDTRSGVGQQNEGERDTVVPANALLHEERAPNPPNHNAEQTASGMAGNEPSRGCDGRTESNGARAANSSTYLTDYMSPNTDDEQQRSTNGVTSGSGGSGRQS